VERNLSPGGSIGPVWISLCIVPVIWLLAGWKAGSVPSRAVGVMTAYLNSHGNDEWHS